MRTSAVVLGLAGPKLPDANFACTSDRARATRKYGTASEAPPFPFAVVGLNMTSPDAWRKAPNPAGPELPDALPAVAAGTFSRTCTSALSPRCSVTLDGETVTEWGEFSEVAGFVVLAP